MERITITLQRPGDGAEIITTIEPDGSVSLQVRNARGVECRALTAELEASIGTVVNRKMDPRALRAAGLTEQQIDAALIKAGAGGGFCG